jgi:o-succinylbenzoate synthase
MGVGEFFQEGDPLTLITLSAQERAALMQAVWERHSQP